MGPAGIVTRLLQMPATEALALRLFPEKEQAHSVLATLHNTAVPTVIRSGEKTNLLPSVVEAEIDGRYLPGQTHEQFMSEVRDIIGDDLEVEIFNQGPPSSTPLDTPLWGQIESAFAKHAPGIPLVPWVLIGYSDTKYLAQLGVKVYGCSPLKLPPGVAFARLPHGHDERLPRTGFEWGMEVFWSIVEPFVTTVAG
jgi:acetylornithine deacetylase/succinyl-diaminopimelate desuccinylase-like protein